VVSGGQEKDKGTPRYGPKKRELDPLLLPVKNGEKNVSSVKKEKKKREKQLPRRLPPNPIREGPNITSWQRKRKSNSVLWEKGGALRREKRREVALVGGHEEKKKAFLAQVEEKKRRKPLRLRWQRKSTRKKGGGRIWNGKGGEGEPLPSVRREEKNLCD